MGIRSRLRGQSKYPVLEKVYESLQRAWLASSLACPGRFLANLRSPSSTWAWSSWTVPLLAEPRRVRDDAEDFGLKAADNFGMRRLGVAPRRPRCFKNAFIKDHCAFQFFLSLEFRPK